MSDQAMHENELGADLIALRHTLEQSRNSAWIALFDEFVEQSEFALALHCICDYLLEPQTKAPGTSTLNLIVKLHTQMQIEDDCVVQLLDKAKASERKSTPPPTAG